jgi:hypothetical protein
MQSINKKWPPTEEQFKNIATSALGKSSQKEVKVLVYWDNSELMIFDPFHYAHTEYVNRKYEVKDRTVEVIIGKED